MISSSGADQLVVIGSSAGGVEALMTLVSTLPAGFTAPVVLAQHLDPTRASHLEEILGRRSALPVRTVADEELLLPGVVYVVPANQHVRITDHHVGVVGDGDGRPKPSIDLLFQTAAAVFGEGLVAVVLTGMGSDGAAGARRVKEAGGTVVIQNPRTASYPSMPQALAPTTVDVVADIDALGPLLHDLLTGAYAPTGPRDDRELGVLLAEVRERSGIDFSSYKQPTIQRRLQRRLIATGTRTLSDYRGYLEEHPEEYDRLINSFLIKVTEFFRDSDLFAALRADVLPPLIARARAEGAQLRIWSAGCATGEEAYSLALLLCGLLGPDRDEFNARIFATDLHGEAVDFARRGVYPASALADVPRELLDAYVEQADGKCEMSKRVRSLVVFGEHDLARRAPFPRIDLVLCRNVLIYFTPELQRRALELFAYSLREGGYLALGKAESVGPLAAHFVPVDASLRLYRREGTRPPIPLPRHDGEGMRLLRPRNAMSVLPEAAGRIRREAPDLPSFLSDADEVLQRLPIGVVLVNRRYDILRISAAARRLLGIYHAAQGEDVVHLVRSVAPEVLRTAVDAALGGTARVVDEVRTDRVVPGETRYLQITCAPHAAPDEEGVPAVLITVVDITAATLGRQAALEEAAGARARVTRLEALAEQLTAANRDLLAANEELTTGNVRLRSSNDAYITGSEELQASSEEVETLNEELQATNEELETLNEELQATNEELETTNEELRARHRETRELAESLDAQRELLAGILHGMGEAVVVLDRQGNVVFANAPFTTRFGAGTQYLVPEDGEGHPLAVDRWPQNRLWTGEAFREDYLLRDLNGELRCYAVTGQVIRPNGTAAEGILTVSVSGGEVALGGAVNRME